MSSNQGLSKKQLRGVVQFIGVIFFTAGLFFILQGEEPMFTLIDKESDFMLGVGMVFVGTMDFVMSMLLFKDNGSK